jgi:hypothetical protein
MSVSGEAQIARKTHTSLFPDTLHSGYWHALRAQSHDSVWLPQGFITHAQEVEGGMMLFGSMLLG